MKIKDQDRIEVRLSGTGGQGLVLASIIVAEAMVQEGFNVLQGESHGIEARGGASRGELIASKGEIYDLAVQLPDIFVALSQEACTRFHKPIKEDALVIYDSFLVDDVPAFNSKNVYGFPFTRVCREELNTIVPVNITCIGAIAALSQLTDLETMKKAVLNRVPRGSEELNSRAFELGVRLAQEARS